MPITWPANLDAAKIGPSATTLVDQALKRSAGSLTPSVTVAIGKGPNLGLIAQAGTYAPGGKPVTGLETMYDMASVTKVAATTMVAMLLFDEHRIDLDAKAVTYWPELKGLHKGDITIRQMLTHTSGLPDIPINKPGRAAALAQFMKVSIVTPGVVVYSDMNMVMLWEIEGRIIGSPVERLLAERVWHPLGMCHTGFNPAKPCVTCAPSLSQLTPGVPSDGTAVSFDGVTGNAGLFSTAEDMGRFAALMANRGILFGKRIISESTVDLFIKAQVDSRALGWDTQQEHAPAPTSGLTFGHTGWTGTSVEVDPTTKSWAVVLTTYRVGTSSPDTHTLTQLRHDIIVAASS